MNEQARQFELELSVDIDDEEQSTALIEMLTELDLDGLVEKTLQAVGVTQAVLVSLMITSDQTIQAFNKQYRHQDKPTDVLSFPLLDVPLVNAPSEQLWMPYEEEEEEDRNEDELDEYELPVNDDENEQEDSESVQENIPTFVTPPELLTNLGDIVISWPTVQRQASEAGHSATYELLFLLAHGILHLVGYDDHSEAGYLAMVGIQESVLQAAGQRA
jgi:probable rRNA maturation factor